VELNEARLVTSFFVGFLFAQMGSVTQVLWRNKLASTSTLGIDGLAVLIYLLTFFSQGLWLLPVILIFIGYVAKKSTQDDDLNSDKLIIMGMALNLAVGAIFSILQFFVVAMNIDFPTQIWFGQMRWVTMQKIYVILTMTFLWNIYLIKKRKIFVLNNLNPLYVLLSGIKISKEKIYFWFVLLIINFVLTYYFGVFTFLSLVFPHFLRFFSYFKGSILKEIFVGPLFCGVFLMLLDQLVWYYPIWGVEIPVGLLASIIGSFSLIFLLIQKVGRNLGKTS
jgi:ABC-type Fe3+-siderophore transport system permease subunit